MPDGQAAVAQATAAVFVNGRRSGSAVLVTDRYLVTAAHVLGSNSRAELEFPAASLGNRVAASRLDLTAATALDVAVLDLGDDGPGWLPAPISVRPAARPPGVVRVFGYPLAERHLKGTWPKFDVAGPAVGGLLQLDWASDVGTFPGHSGGPVVDISEWTLAGILVEGSDRGRFDRYLPVTMIARVWPQMPRPWLAAGGEPGEARSHFTQRSRGQHNAVRGGDLFRGRQKALDRISKWLTADKSPGLPLVVTGQPGAGKSAVLARAALGVEATRSGPGLAFHARDATAAHFLDSLASLVGLDTPASVAELAGARLAGPPIAVVVDALDEAASDQDRRQIAQALADLAVLPGLRVAVATRPLATGNPYTPGSLLPSLGVMERGAPNLLDLDDDTYFDVAGLRQFAAALLIQEEAEHPGPPGTAWASYRELPAVRDRLAVVIAERARRNFLVAAMASVPLSTAREVKNPAIRGFDPASIPSGVGEALAKYLNRLPQPRRELDRALLTALAYARGSGLDDLSWLAFAAALGYHATMVDLEVMRRSAAADYLLERVTIERGARPVTRLFHQALADELLAVRHRPSDESLLLEMLLGQGRSTDWHDRYAREHAAKHASVADRLDELLADPGYLISADPERLVPHFDNARSGMARAVATVYRQAAHYLTADDRLMRASQIELTAHRLGCRNLAARIAEAVPERPWHTQWSRGHGPVGHQVLAGHSGTVYALAAGAMADGKPVVVSGGSDGTVRVWQLADGAPVGEPLRGHDGRIHAVATGVTADGTAVVVSGGQDRTVRVWQLADGAPIGKPMRGHRDSVYAVAMGALADGTPVVISGGIDGTVRVWRLGDGRPIGKPRRGHDKTVVAVATAVLADGSPVVISGGIDGTVRVWRLRDGKPIGEALRRVDGLVFSAATGVLPDGALVAVNGAGMPDGTVRVRRLGNDGSVRESLHGHDGGPVFAVALGVLADDVPVVVGAGGVSGATVRVWRLDNGGLVGGPLRGHGGRIHAVATGALADGTPVVVSGGSDGTVRVWRLADGAPGGETQHGHDGDVDAVATGALADGTPVVVSGGSDGTVRVWQLADGAPRGEPQRGHNGRIHAVATGALADGTPVVVSGGSDGTVRVWQLADGAPVGEPRHGHEGDVYAVATGALTDGTPVVVSGGHDGTVRVQRLADGALVGEPKHVGPRSVFAVALGMLTDGTPLVASGGRDGVLLVRRLGDGIRKVCGRTTASAIYGHWRQECWRTTRQWWSAVAVMARCGCGGWVTVPR